MDLRTGLGYDVHPLVQGRPLVVGGVLIENSKKLGLEGHSDGDVLTHAFMDAIIGACGYGSIGEFFPQEPQWKDSRSIFLLKDLYTALSSRVKIEIFNFDCIVISDIVKITQYGQKMKENLSDAVGVLPQKINIKGKSGNGVGSSSSSKSVEAYVSVLLSIENSRRQ
jgi:2-C-methyl-D-erythritol 2,4-cyclodiphosphate synthase